MARWGERGWKNSWRRRVAGKLTKHRGMEEARENGKETSNSAHANGMNKLFNFFGHSLTEIRITFTSVFSLIGQIK